MTCTSFWAFARMRALSGPCGVVLVEYFGVSFADGCLDLSLRSAFAASPQCAGRRFCQKW